MKVWSFIKWQVKKISISDALWYTACGLIGSSLLSLDTESGKYRFLAGAMIISGILVKYVFLIMKANYQRFQEEQNNLFETIKSSDKQ